MKAKTITVKVTARDISKGKKYAHWPWACPIYRALDRFGLRTAVWYDEIVVTGHERTHHIRMPRRIGEIQERMCADAPVKPFSFKLKVPVDAL